MTTYDVYFHTVAPEDFRIPYVRDGDSVVYECDGSCEGTIAFNGYYYVENGPPPYPEESDPDIKPWDKPQRHSEWLPKKAVMSLTHRDKEPYKRVADKENKFMTHIFYKEYKKDFFMIEIYKMEVYESTNVISEIEDEDGEPMKVCFFPTNQIKLWFRILENFNETILPKRVLFKIHIMPNTLYADSDEYKKILAWGQNTYDEWYHPVSRHQFTKGLTEVKVGDTIPFNLDGLSQPVEVLEIMNIYDYPKMRHVNGDFHISTLMVDRVIRVRRV